MTGRNDICPCNSGKKYKKCCLIKEHEAEAKERQEIDAWLKLEELRGKKLLEKYRDEYRKKGIII